MSELNPNDLNKHFTASHLKDAIPLYHGVADVIKRVLSGEPNVTEVSKTDHLWTIKYKHSAMYSAEVSLFKNGAVIRYMSNRRVTGSHFSEDAIRLQHKYRKLFPINGMRIKDISYSEIMALLEYTVIFEVDNEQPA